MRLSIKNAFFAGAIGFAALFSTICGVVSAEEEKNYTIATGSDLITDLSHLDLIYDVIPVLQDDTPGNQQHGNINIEGTGLFGEGLGIGTTTPAGILHVIGTTTIFSSSVGIGTETPGTELYVIGTVTATAFVGGSSGLAISGDGHSLDALDGNPVDAVFVDAVGDVGIGVASPLAQLHVKTGTSSVSEVSIHGDEFVLENDDNVGMTMLGGTSGAARIKFGDSGDNQTGEIQYNLNSEYMTFFTNGHFERVRIDSSGDVGIGTSAPNSKLQVSGGDIYVDTQSNGLILKDTNGSGCHRITVNSAGSISATAVTCP